MGVSAEISQISELGDIVNLSFYCWNSEIRVLILPILEIGPNASALLEIDSPEIDWVSLAKTFAVDAERVNSMDRFSRAIDAGLATQGPYLIEVAF